MQPETVANPMRADPGIRVRRLGTVDFEPTWRRMQSFTAERQVDTADEIWLLEHPPVFTLGLGADAKHLLRDVEVPLIRTDRGGQITYHGPGQLVAYTLIDLRRRSLGVRALVAKLEQGLIELLAGYGIAGTRRERAPGVYVGNAKIGSLGLRVKGGCSYHGVSLNADIDLTPFGAINVCGYEGLAVTRLRDLGVADPTTRIGERLVQCLIDSIGR
jgi:lipoyl(octanoyl) transferase